MQVAARYRKFWMAFEVSQAKLAIFRVAFFSLFALDAWLHIARAPRYGANNFNVGHFPVLDNILPMPTSDMMVTVFLLQSYLAVRIALGATSRLYTTSLALLFSFGYFISQLNSLQHHYLLAILLGILVLFPWHSGSKQKSSDQRTQETTQRNWPVRMVLVSLSIVYLFAVVAKSSVEWTSGETLRRSLTTPSVVRDLVEYIGWSGAAIMALIAELSLVILLHVRRLWPIAMATGILMHMSFEWAGLKIGLFSYFMAALYLLLLPESVIRFATWQTRFCTALLGVWCQTPERLPRKRSSPTLGWSLLAVSAFASVGLALLLPLHPVACLVVIPLVAADLIAAHRKGRARPAVVGLTHIVAVLALVLLANTTNSVRDYFLYQGTREKRADNTELAIAAYENLVAHAPRYPKGHQRLADIYQANERSDEALVQYEAGLAIDPTHDLLNFGAAKLYHLQGQGQEALRCAERALDSRRVRKRNRAAMKRIRDYWRLQGTSNSPD